MECPVCYNRFTDNAVTALCGHVFCKQCVDEIIESKADPVCPSCNRELKKEEIHPVYLPNIIRDDSQQAESTTFHDEIMLTRIDDLELAKASFAAQTTAIVAKLDQLQINYSKIDSDNATIMKENKALKDELKDLKKMMQGLKARKSTEVIDLDDINADMSVIEIN